MTNTLFSIPALLACCLLGACATEPAVYHAATVAQAPIATPALPLATRRPAPVKTPLPAATTLTPLDYYQWAKAATPQQATAERLRLTMRHKPDDPVIDMVHLSMVLSLSPLATPETEQQAMALLDSVDGLASKSEDGREYAIFADFLRSHLQQREDLRSVTSSVVESREEVETLERNNHQLQEKIEALTTLEQQLIEREQEQEPQ
jgi:hypothetical protein